ncbi:hypothetical protein GOP47_0029044 [Adiantum capillus-veneris]|nr:hypothetical protein GOP47_0029044 [Adiantum capillus-veneris]
MATPPSLDACNGEARSHARLCMRLGVEETKVQEEGVQVPQRPPTHAVLSSPSAQIDYAADSQFHSGCRILVPTLPGSCIGSLQLNLLLST